MNLKKNKSQNIAMCLQKENDDFFLKWFLLVLQDVFYEYILFKI